MSDFKEAIYVNGRYVGFRIVNDPHPPATPPVTPTTPLMSKGTFMDRFSSQTHTEMLELAKVDPTMSMAKHSFDIREYIDVTNPKTIGLVQYLVFKEILTESEAADILAPIAVDQLGAIVLT